MPSPLHSRVASLSSRHRALLEDTLERPSLRAIGPRPQGGEVPLSSQQMSLWLAQQMLPGVPFLNNCLAFRLRGPLDVPRLEDSLRRLLERHAALRLRFPAGRQGPVQELLEPDQVAPMTVETCSESQVLARLESDAAIPFDLENGPSFRCRLLRLGADDNVLALICHHLVSDSWSKAIMVRELSGQAADASIDYLDYAVWQAAQPTGPEVGPYRPVRLPLATRSGRCGLVEIAWSETRLTRLRQAALTLDVTPFTLAMAAFALLLRRYGVDDDMVVPISLAGRSLPEVHAVVGNFVYLAPLPLTLRATDSVRMLLRQIAEASARAQDLTPAQAAAAWARPVTLLPVTFNFDNVGSPALQIEGVQAEPFLDRTISDGVELGFELAVGSKAAALRVMYDDGWLDAGGARSLARHYENLLDAISSGPTLRIGEVRMLDDSETGRIARWSEGPRGEATREGMVERFGHVTKRQPQALAVIDGEVRLTYEELDSRSSAVAAALADRGVRAGEPVGTLLPRSWSAIVAWLGILKCGAVYVPLAWAAPSQFATIVKRLGIGVVLDDTHDFTKVAERAAVTAIRDQPAAILHTSGTTGVPKAIAIEQSAVMNLVLTWRGHGIETSDGIVHACDASFDLAIMDIWGALLNGARCVILGEDELLSSTAWAKAVEAGGTVAMLTPSVWRRLLTSPPPAFNRIHLLVSSGEVMPADLAARMLEVWSPRRLVNAYGPTETTTFSTWYEGTTPLPTLETMPIGRPLANTSLRVLDRDGQWAPPLAPGELYIGGAGLANGYLHDPERTRERFVELEGQRFYRTGDIVRWLPDGLLQWLGRADTQLKLFGHRIEPIEIENALCAHAEVVAVAVVPVLAGDQPHLVAHYTTRHGAALPARQLRAFLLEKLPSWMIPQRFAHVAHIELNAHGKVERGGLVPIAVSPPGVEASLSRLEDELLTIWRDVFKLEGIGAEDDFFELGGTSLTALQLLDVVQMAYGRSISLRELFEASTVRALAARLEEQAATGDRRPMVRFEGPSQARPIFLTCLTSPVGMVPLARRLAATRTACILHPLATSAATTERIDVTELAERYVEQVRGVQAQGPYHLAGFCGGGLLAYETARILRQAREEVACLFLIDAVPRIGGLNRARMIVENVGMGRWRRPRPALAASASEQPLVRLEAAAVEAVSRYRPARYDGDAHVYVSADERPLYLHRARRSWSRYITGRLVMHETPAAHEQMLVEPELSRLVRYIVDAID
jgi:amino acid adenylation domain-containing protein